MATSSDVIKSFTIKVNTDNGKIKIDGLTKSYVKADKALGMMSKGLTENTIALKANASAHKQVDAAAGGATAVSLEFGRVVSDAPYGIRGVANNLTQMASQFTQLTAKIDPATGKAVGFSRAIKTIGGTFLGPAGILLAFTAGIALLDTFAGNMKFFSEGPPPFKTFEKSAGDAAQDLKILMNQVERGNITTEDLALSVKGANKEYKDLNLSLDENGQMTRKSVDAVYEKIDALERIAVVEAMANLRAEEETKILEAKIEAERDLLEEGFADLQDFEDRKDEFVRIQDGRYKGQIDSSKLRIKATLQDAVNTFAEVEKEGQIVLDKLADYAGDKGDVNKLLRGNDSGGSRPRGRAMKIFKEQILDLDKFILQQNQKRQEAGVRNEIELLRIAEEGQIKEIELRKKAFQDKQAIRLKDYIASVQTLDNAQELIDKANKTYNKSVTDSEIETGEAKQAIRLNYAKQTALKEEEILLELSKREGNTFLKMVRSQISQIDPMAIPLMMPALASARQQQMDALKAQLSAAEEGGSDLEVQAAQQNINEFNEEMRQEDIDLEAAYYQRKKDIQMEYVGFAKGIGTLMSKIAGDNEALKKASLIVEKGAATADVVISAQKSIAQRTAVNSAMLGPAQAADAPFMAKDIARTKISSGIAIANIWAAGMGSKSNPSSGGSGGGGGRTFDFNLVGSTGQNQLAQETAGQLNQPVQAYVVSSNITNSQALDSQIQSDATFGED